LINLFATLILLLAFAMISQRRIVSLINLFMLARRGAGGSLVFAGLCHAAA
jgi:hypothetical protein